ncbi:MAG TPA: FAD-binding oxidoreductase [Candidatus Paceibacterota bacterium]
MSTAAGQRSLTCRLIDVQNRTHDVSTFVFAPEGDEKLDFIPGQYVTLYFNDGQFPWQGKSYSLSNLPRTEALSITVKRQGVFSGAIHSLRIGETVRLAGPEGCFFPEKHMKKVVFLASGIGIVPFYTILKDIAASPPAARPSVTLINSVRKRADAVFREELERLRSDWLALNLITTVTQDRPPASGSAEESRRIDIDMLRTHQALSPDAYYFMCGSIAFVHDMWKMLGTHGIPEDHLFTEAYY